MKSKLLFILVVMLTSSLFAQTGTIEISITGIENSDGVIRIGLYNSPANFPDNDKKLGSISIKANEDGVSHIFVDVPVGEYAIAVWHDENEDNEIDRHFYGPPSESYGFSLNKYGSMGPPDFEDVSFKVEDGIAKQLTINLE